MNEAVPSVVAIDIGTHKVSVLIGKVHAPDNIQVIGMAAARNRGMNKGKIVSLDKVITAIKNAVQEAEDMAECRVHSAWISIPSAELKSFYASGRTPVANTDQTITTNEVVRALELAKASHLTSDHYLVSAVPLGFELDDAPEWVLNPIRMSAQSMTGHYHLMMLPISTMQNLDRALKGANIGVERLLVELVKGLRQPALLRVCRQQILTRQRRQQGSGIIEGPLCRPAHARLHFLDKDRQHKPRGDGHDQEVP